MRRKKPPPRTPSPSTILVDECLSPKIVEAVWHVHRTPAPLVHVSDLELLSRTDDEILASLRARWPEITLFLTRDGRMLMNHVEAVKAWGGPVVTVPVIAAGRYLTQWDYLRLVLRHWDRLRELAGEAPPDRQVYWWLKPRIGLRQRRLVG